MVEKVKIFNSSLDVNNFMKTVKNPRVVGIASDHFDLIFAVQYSE